MNNGVDMPIRIRPIFILIAACLSCLAIVTATVEAQLSPQDADVGMPRPSTDPVPGNNSLTPGTTPDTGSIAFPETDEPEKPAQNSEGRNSVFEIIRSAGIVGLVIVVLSIAAVALVIEHLLTIRQRTMIPKGFGDEIHALLSAGRLKDALARCRKVPGFLSLVLEAGIIEIENGWQSVEKSVEDAIAEQAARLFRKIEYLSVIGNIAPMLGLLGTVIGMIFSFQTLSDLQGAAMAGDLAGGIYKALITTVLGLVVAIPALAAFAIFRNRIDHMTAEVAYVAQHVFGPVKRSLMRPQMPIPRPAPPIPPEA